MKAGSFFDENINGQSFAGFGPEEYLMELCLDQVYEVTLAGAGVVDPTKTPGAGASAHPYHQHVNHFQMATSDTANGALWRKGEWRDVVPLPFWGSKFRFKPAHFPGEIIVHCHMLEHEDMGMMGLMKVSDCSVADTMGVCNDGVAVATDQASTTFAASSVTEAASSVTEATIESQSAAIVSGAAAMIAVVAVAAAIHVC
jgi:hypothetical protein